MKQGQITFLISDENLARLKKIAIAHGVKTVNSLLGNIVKEYIQVHEGCGVCEHSVLSEQKSLEATD